MTDDITPDPGTFDLIGAIDGTVRPEETVRFLFDERAAQAVANIEDELKRLAMLGKTDEYDALDKVKDQLIEDLKGSIYTVTLRSIPRKVKKAIFEAVEAKHPDKKSPLGIAEPNYDGVEYLNTLKWQAQIVGFESPDGKKAGIPLSEAEVQYLLDNGPEASLAAVAEGIEKLETGPKSGYDQVVQGLDFLSKP